jgi:sugar O-acyltransferase (sialic acid O-acetyltransferase NeuD family)
MLSGEPLIIVGAGGHGRETAHAFLLDHADGDFLGFLDDGSADSTPEGWPILGPVDAWLEHRHARCIVAINDPRARRAVVSRIRTRGEPRWTSVFHPDVRLHTSVRHGAGCMFLGGCQLTTNIRLGDHCIINRSAQIGHDCAVGDFVSMNPLACVAGRVQVGNGCELGSACSIRQRVAIGNGATVGMGAVVVNHAPDNRVMVGNPARALKELDPW